MNDKFLRARVRERDKDIQEAVETLKLAKGELADMIRDGFRQQLAQRGVLPPAGDICQLRHLFQQLINRSGR